MSRQCSHLWLNCAPDTTTRLGECQTNVVRTPENSTYSWGAKVFYLKGKSSTSYM